MAETFDVLVIGAGIVGSATADVLAAQGLRVVVLEAAAVGGGATAAGMGHVVVTDGTPAELALTRLGRELWAGWAAELGPGVEHSRCGTLWVAADEAGAAGLHARGRRYGAAGVAAEVLDAAALRAAEPELRPGLAGGLRVPDDAVLYAPRAAALLLQRALGRGAALRRGRAVGWAAGGVRLEDGARITAGAVVVAAGLPAAVLLPELPLRPKKGHLAITDRHPGFIRHQLVETGYVDSAHGGAAEAVAFNVQPRPTGQVLIGSSRQPDRWGLEVEAPVLARMLDAACAFLPGLAALCCLRAWTGLRAATPDDLPLIGAHPARAGLWLAVGHEGLGITTAPATAHLLAAQITGRTPTIDPAPYLPARLLGGEGPA